MARQTVTVTFNPSQTSFTFAPDRVEVTEAGTIELNRSATNWKFKNFALTVANPGDFSWTIADDKITVTDSDADPGEYPYKVTIDYDGHSYTSDPKIVNKQS
jgi:hypothetical protein